MHNEFETKAIIEKHMKAMVEELSVQDDHGIGWIGDDIESHLTAIIFHTIAYSKNVQDYLEKEGMLNA